MSEKAYHTYNNKSQSLEKWAIEFEMPVGTLYSRVYRNKWSLAKSLETPRRFRSKFPRSPSVSSALIDTPEYKAYHAMIARCRPNSHKAHLYSDRGIAVCERWLVGGVLVFIADMGPRPSSKYQLDRIDNDAGYSPDNCRWATLSEQRINQRRTCLITLDGITATRTVHAQRYGIHKATVTSRIKLGWDVISAITTPLLTKPS